MKSIAKVETGPARPLGTGLLLTVAFGALLAGACGGNDSTSNHAPGDPKAPSAQVDEATRAQELYVQAKKKLAEENYVEAVPLLEKASLHAPNDWQIQADLGRASMQLRRYQQARDALLRAAESVDESDAAKLRMLAAECSHRLAHEAYTSGQNEAALKHIQDAQGLRGGDPDLQMLLGYVHHRRGEYTQASAAFALAAAAYGGARRHDALRWQGQSRFDGGEYGSAIEPLNVLIREGYTSNDVYGLRAYALNQLGRNDEARSDFLKAAEFATKPEKREEYLAFAAALLQDEE